MDRIKSELKASEFSYRIYLILYYVLIILLLYALLCFSVRHTYQLPITSPGVLVTDRWDFNFFREWFFWLYGLVVLSGPFMRLNRTRGGAGVHIGLLILLLGWGVVNIVFDAIHMSKANVGPAADNFDQSTLARDPRWCCVFGGQPGTGTICANNYTIATCPAVGIAQLRVDRIFLFRVVLNYIFIGFILYDLIITWSAYLPLLTQYLNKKKSH